MTSIGFAFNDFNFIVYPFQLTNDRQQGIPICLADYPLPFSFQNPFPGQVLAQVFILSRNFFDH